MLSVVTALLIHLHFWFVLAVVFRRNDMADVGWAPGFIILSGVLLGGHLVAETAIPVRDWVVFALVALWAVRLGGYLGVRTFSKGEDHRYQEMRANWGKNWILQSYLRVYLLQTVLLGLVGLPLVAILARPSTESWSASDSVATVIALFGIVYEAVADEQKRRFKRAPNAGTKIIDVGLWRCSRHPNYFGEIVFWIGITCFTLPNFSTQWWGWLGPALLTLLLRRVSGVPLLEKSYKGRPGYDAYMKRSLFLPKPW